MTTNKMKVSVKPLNEVLPKAKNSFNNKVKNETLQGVYKQL